MHGANPVRGFGPATRRVTSRLVVSVSLWTGVGASLPALAEEPAPRRLQIILDASGSMYNKLADGRYRISAAKDVLRAFIEGLPADDLDVGLRVYGAQKRPDEPGACEDSALVVPMSGFDRPGLIRAVADVRGRGKTPIAYSLERAAADFDGSAERCMVLLVTDGEEVCDGDLDAAAAKLRAAGCTVDLRIVGFDLPESAHAAFERIGQFENATDARGLAEALGRAAEPIAPASPLGAATLEAPASVTAGTRFEVRFTAEEGPRDYVTIVPAGARDGEYRAYAYTSRGNPVALYAPIDPGAYELRYQSDRAPGVAARRAIEVLPAEVALDAPVKVDAGRPFDIAWIGPDGPQDYITLVAADAAAGKYGAYVYTKTGSPVRIHAPITPGAYEIRYQSDREAGIFARRPVEVVPAVIVLDAPDEVEAGRRFEVAWQGPDGAQDYLTIVAKSASPGTYGEYVYTRVGPRSTLHAPLQPGEYEVRYQSDREKGIVFARIAVRVAPVRVTLTAPDEVSAGEKLEVAWEGPDGDRDYVTIVAADAAPGTYGAYLYTRTGSVLSFKAPNAPGDYELRYQTDRVSGVVLARRALRVR